MSRLVLVRFMLLFASGCAGGGTTPDASPSPDARDAAGTMSVRWSLKNPAGTPISCAQVGATVMALELRPSSGGTGQNVVFTCDALSGTSGAIRPGTYDVDITLTAGTSGQLGETVMQKNVPVLDLEDTPLADVLFVVEETGGFKMTLDSTLDTGKNCDQADPTSAKITGHKLELTSPQGDCIAGAAFLISAGTAGAAASYSNCSMESTGCIENDQEVSVVGLTAGHYRLLITGYEGVNACYGKISEFDVPGGDLVKDLFSVQVPIDQAAVDLMLCQSP